MPLIRIVRPQLCEHPYFSLMAGPHVIDGGHILHDFGGEDASYLSQENFEKLHNGDDEASLEVRLKPWCRVKLG